MTPLIRQATPEDMRYVRHAWLKMTFSTLRSEAFHCTKQASFRNDQGDLITLRPKLGSYHAFPSFSLFDKLFRGVQARILAHAQVLVALNPDDHAQVLGYVIYGPGVCYFVQVKKDFEKMRIASQLLEAAKLGKEEPIVYAFPTPLSSVPKAWVFVPWYLHAEIMKHG